MIPSCPGRLLFPALASLLLLQSACVNPHRASLTDRRVFAAYERAAARAEASAADSLVHFRVEQAASSQSGRDRRPGTVTFAGVVLTEDGHLLAPFTIRPDTADRIEAWIGERSYLAHPLKFDDSIGMTIMKVEPAEALTPIDLSNIRDLRTGEHAFVVLNSDEDSEFMRFTFNTFCQGIIEGRYRQFSLSPLPNQTRGAPLYNIHGELVGLTSQTNAWALSDLKQDLLALLDEATGRGETDASRTENAWFGASLSPINRDYARAKGLPRSALWLIHVYEDSPAHKAGFRSGDLLVGLNDEPLRLSGPRVYQYFMQTLRPRVGTEFSATALRDGKTIRGEGTMETRPEPRTFRAEDLGITVSEINEILVMRHNLFIQEGVLITDIDRGSPAATGRQFGRNLLMPRDVITAIGGHPTPTLSDFNEAIDQIRRERRNAVLVEFMRGPTTGFEALNLRLRDRTDGTN